MHGNRLCYMFLQGRGPFFLVLLFFYIYKHEHMRFHLQLLPSLQIISLYSFSRELKYLKLDQNYTDNYKDL